MNYETVKSELNFGKLEKRVFGTYDAIERGEGQYLEITELDVLEHFKDDIIELEDILEAYKDVELEILENDITWIKEELNCLEDIENVISRLEQIQERKEELENLDLDSYNFMELDDVEYLDISGNSYNWNSSAVVNWQGVKFMEQNYIAISFHRFGDVRANYTEYIFVEVNDSEAYEFFEKIAELEKSVIIETEKGSLAITQKFSSESGVIDIYSEELDVDLYDVFIDLELNDIEDIKEKTLDYLVKEGVLNVVA